MKISKKSLTVKRKFSLSKHCIKFKNNNANKSFYEDLQYKFINICIYYI